MTKSKDDTSFRLVKAVVDACNNERELRLAIDALVSAGSRSRIIESLEALLYRSPAPAQSKILAESRYGSAGLTDPTVKRVFSHLKRRGMTAPQVHDIILRTFQLDIPVRKEGLAKYLKRVSTTPIFRSLVSYLMAREEEKSARSGQDPWVQQMLTERKKRSRDKDTPE